MVNTFNTIQINSLVLYRARFNSLKYTTDSFNLLKDFWAPSKLLIDKENETLTLKVSYLYV